MHNLLDNNKLVLAGKVIDTPKFYNEIYDEKFYTLDIEIPRLSETSDVLPALVSEKLLKGVEVGSYIKLDGQLRSYNRYEDDKRKLLLFAFAREIKVISLQEFLAIESPNELTLKGFLCKNPVYRATPLGREITDLLVAVNRAYKKSDYIPAIAWGRNARFCKDMAIGNHVEIIGRLQSRKYNKKIENMDIPKMAYEVSVTNINYVEENTEANAVETEAVAVTE